MPPLPKNCPTCAAPLSGDLTLDTRDKELIRAALSYLLSNLDDAKDALDLEMTEQEVSDLEGYFYTKAR